MYEFESRVFPEGTQTSACTAWTFTGLRAVYFQRGLKQANPQYLPGMSLRAVYFQRGLKRNFFKTYTFKSLRAVYFQRGLKLNSS